MFQILSLGSMILSLKTMRNIIIIIFILKLLLTYRLNVSNNIECNEIDSNNKSNNYDYNSIDLVDEFFEKHHEVLEVYTVSYSSWSQFLMMVATIFATYKNGLRHLAATTFATTLLSFFGLRHGTLIILSILI